MSRTDRWRPTASHVRGVLAATFHSVCARLLREHATLFGRTDAYTIYDQADVRRVIDALLIDHGREAIQQAITACGQPSATELETELALAKSRLLDPAGYLAASRYPAAAVTAAGSPASATPSPFSAPAT